MKNRFVGLMLMAESFLAIIALLCLGVCTNHDGMTNCNKSYCVSIAIFATIFLMGLIVFIYKKKDISTIPCWLAIILSGAVVLVAYFIIGICEMPTMVCRKYTFPIVTSIVILSIVTNIIFLTRQKRR